MGVECQSRQGIEDAGFSDIAPEIGFDADNADDVFGIDAILDAGFLDGGGVVAPKIRPVLDMVLGKEFISVTGPTAGFRRSVRRRGSFQANHRFQPMGVRKQPDQIAFREAVSLHHVPDEISYRRVTGVRAAEVGRRITGQRIARRRRHRVRGRSGRQRGIGCNG